MGRLSGALPRDQGGKMVFLSGIWMWRLRPFMIMTVIGAIALGGVGANAAPPSEETERHRANAEGISRLLEGQVLDLEATRQLTDALFELSLNLLEVEDRILRERSEEDPSRSTRMLAIKHYADLFPLLEQRKFLQSVFNLGLHLELAGAGLAFERFQSYSLELAAQMAAYIAHRFAFSVSDAERLASAREMFNRPRSEIMRGIENMAKLHVYSVAHSGTPVAAEYLEWAQSRLVRLQETCVRAELRLMESRGNSARREWILLSARIFSEAIVKAAGSGRADGREPTALTELRRLEWEARKNEFFRQARILQNFVRSFYPKAIR